jgi:hypothetical protein
MYAVEWIWLGSANSSTLCNVTALGLGNQVRTHLTIHNNFSYACSFKYLNNQMLTVDTNTIKVISTTKTKHNHTPAKPPPPQAQP